MMPWDLYDLGRAAYVCLSLYGLWVLVTRWRVSRVLTPDRRLLFLFFVLELVGSSYSGSYKLLSGAAGDPSVFVTVLTQFFLAAYLHASVPRERRPRRHRRRST